MPRLAALASGDAHVAGLDQDQRDREAQELAQQFGEDRTMPFPRNRIRNDQDRESVASMLLTLRARDFEALLPDEDLSQFVAAAPDVQLNKLRAQLAAPLDFRQGEPIGDVSDLGTLIGSAMSADHLPEPGLMVTLTFGGWMPHGSEWTDRMRALDENRAGAIRDLLRAASLNRPAFDLLRRPDLAGMQVVLLDRITDALPQLLDRSRWPAQVRDALAERDVELDPRRSADADLQRGNSA